MKTARYSGQYVCIESPTIFVDFDYENRFLEKIDELSYCQNWGNQTF